MESAQNSLSEKTVPAHPVRREERLISLDLIRGIAVLGILLANITGFAHVDIAYYWPPALPGGATVGDKIVWLAQFVLVDGKFRGLFTILFGASLVLFVERIPNFPAAIRLQARRLGWLALFGLAHFFLLFRGDILFSYAMAGFFALFALSLKGERLIVIGIIWALAGGILQSLTYLTPAMIEAGNLVSAHQSEAVQFYRDYWQERLLEAQLQEQLVTGGGYADILRYRVLGEADILGSYFSYNFFETIPLMLIGMGLYRSGIFAGSTDVPSWRGLAIGGVLLGLALNLASGIMVYAQGFPPFTTQLAFFGLSNIANVPLLVGGTCLLAQWAAQPRDSWLSERLSAAGRMAFTNYVGTSLVMVLIFQGWAGGLFGQLHRLELLLVVALGWALMLQFSRIWLARFRYGPLEYLWRCLTYWQIFPLRR